MRRFASFVPGLFAFSLLVSFACSNKQHEEKPKIYKSTPGFQKKKSPNSNPTVDEKKIDSSLYVSPDSTVSDSAVFHNQQVMDTMEISIEPMRRPTFKHFYKYNHLHKKSPIVAVPGCNQNCV